MKITPKLTQVYAKILFYERLKQYNSEKKYFRKSLLENRNTKKLNDG
jgi:hypothetical protein